MNRLLLALPGLILLLLNGIWVGLALGTVCARFRDMPQIMTSLIQVAFYLTPVMYPKLQLPEKWRWLFRLNPFLALDESGSGLPPTVVEPCQERSSPWTAY